MVARNEDGEVKSYPLVEMEFDDKTNICDTVIVPAREDESIAKKAAEIAIQCIEALNGNGIFGVGMFLTKEKEIIVNEIAPRPHNSGHYTIEGCMTSQYEQFLRAILNMPLGSTKLLFPSAMVNVLGEKGYTGNVFVEELIIKYGFPVVQKSCRGGYDGKGVFVLKNREDINNMLKSESFFEKYVPFEKEIAVMVARNEDGEVKRINNRSINGFFSWSRIIYNIYII